MARFLSASKRANLVVDFEKLKQILGMSIKEHNMEFTQLSRYAPLLVVTEALRVERFI